MVGSPYMSMSLDQIHNLEFSEDYPAAIDELESRLKENPNEVETIVRLGFNLWYAVVENDCLKKNLPVQQYASRFMALFSQYHDTLKDNADFCWVFGQGIQMFWFFFPGAYEKMGQSLIDKACSLDDFYRRFWKGMTHTELVERFKGRGIFERYYCTPFVGRRGEKQSTSSRPPIQKWAVAAIFIFFVIGYLLASPCLCIEGSVKGAYKTVFYLIVLARLLYGLFKRNLRPAVFFLWVGGFLLFVFIAENL